MNNTRVTANPTWTILDEKIYLKKIGEWALRSRSKEMSRKNLRLLKVKLLNNYIEAHKRRNIFLKNVDSKEVLNFAQKELENVFNKSNHRWDSLSSY